MSSEFLTIEEAARVLGVTARTIRRYTHDGLLTYQKTAGRKKMLQAMDVEDLRRDRDISPVLRRKEVLEIRAAMRRLQAEMAAVLRILDAKDHPLGITPEYGKTLYDHCTGQLRRGSWDEGEISPWVEVFLRANEGDFQAIARATGDPKPWKPFLLLNMAMTNRVVTHEQYATSLSLQGMHRTLAEGRRRLRMSALIYTDLYGTTEDRDLRRMTAEDLPHSMMDTLQGLLKGRINAT